MFKINIDIKIFDYEILLHDPFLNFIINNKTKSSQLISKKISKFYDMNIIIKFVELFEINKSNPLIKIFINQFKRIENSISIIINSNYYIILFYENNDFKNIKSIEYIINKYKNLDISSNIKKKNEIIEDLEYFQNENKKIKIDNDILINNNNKLMNDYNDLFNNYMTTQNIIETLINKNTTLQEENKILNDKINENKQIDNKIIEKIILMKQMGYKSNFYKSDLEI